ncbi:hypothetical protein [Flaviaesturariibacter flavus]|nr:hypothetical protein [Flaviaesturariibacter flavus]
MGSRNLSWSELRGLHELFVAGETRLAILNSAYVKRLKTDRRLIDYKFGNRGVFVAKRGYSEFYEEVLMDDFIRYSDFFSRNGIENDGRRNYDEYDLNTLLFIERNQSELANSLTTIRQFSAIVFKGKGSKYLQEKRSLKKAVCKILGIEEFPDKDPKTHQWRLVVDCLNPEAVVLCENIAYLKSPDSARANNIEPWYVGGNNIAILEHIPPSKLALPLYYSCDWDLAGLQIYVRIKRLLREKGISIGLFFPYETSNRLSVNSPFHRSKWNSSIDFSGLPEDCFTARERSLIGELIRQGRWIEEEGLDLISNFVFNHNR